MTAIFKRKFKNSWKILGVFFFIFYVTLAQADLPVIDAANFQENFITALKAVAAVATQIKQYKTQLKQYQDELQNSVSMAQTDYIWSQINTTINNLLQATDTLDYYKNQAGSLQNYLARYQDVAYYQNSPCFSATGCSAQQRQQLMVAIAQASSAQKKANDAMLLGIDQQQATLKNDATALSALQQQAQSAQGRMQALQTANELASAVANQLFQIRALLIAQQNAAATRAQVVVDREAQQAAAQQQLLKGSFEKSPVVLW